MASLGRSRGRLHRACRAGNNGRPPADRRAPADRATGHCFAVIFVGEWGDITQITTVNFAARYHNVLLVGAAAALALWAVSGLAVFLGPKVLVRIPRRWIRLVGAVALTGFGIYSLVQALW